MVCSGEMFLDVHKTINRFFPAAVAAEVRLHMHLDLWAKHARLWWSPALVRGQYLGCWPAALLSSYGLLGPKAERDGASLQSLLHFVPAES